MRQFERWFVWQQPDIRTHEWATNTWEQLGEQLDEAKNEVTLIKSLIDQPVWQFNLDYSQGVELFLPHLPTLRDASLWLCLHAMYCLRQQQPDEACRDARAMLALIRGQTDEPFLISQLVRCAIVRISAGVTWQILQFPDISDEALAQLQRDWESVEFIDPMDQALLMERAIGLQIIDQYRRSRRPLRQWFPDRSGFIRRHWHHMQWKWYWSYKDELRGLHAWQVIVQASRVARTHHSFEAVESFSRTNFSQLGIAVPHEVEGIKMHFELEDLRWFLSESASSAFCGLRRAMTAETVREMVSTAIALKRFELRHNKLPEALKELTPELVKTIPRDYRDGQFLRYRKVANRFVLYSVGEDGKDDNGDSKPANKKSEWRGWPLGRDFVWPQAASPEEVRADDEKLDAERKPPAMPMPEVITEEARKFAERYGLAVTNEIVTSTNSPK